MKHLSYLSPMRGIGSLLVILLFANCQKDNISTTLNPSDAATESLAESQSIGSGQILSQTKTGNLFFRGSSRWNNAQPQFLSANDNLFTYSPKLNSTGRAFLVLEDFRFEIPQNAIITNIIVGTRRFKKGKPSLKDCFVHLIKNNDYNGWSPYGVQMAKPDLWQSTETEVVYTQPGMGNNGMDKTECMCTANQPYQWTPEFVNGAHFGIYLLTNFPTGGGTLEVYYDQVQITIEYSLP